MIKRVLNALKTTKFYNFVFNRSCVKIFHRKCIINGIIIYCVTLVMVLFYKYSPSGNNYYLSISESRNEIFKHTSSEDHNLTVSKYFEMRKYWKTSNLGTLLFKNEKNLNFTQKQKTFIILVWKYWDWLQIRHVHKFGPAVRSVKDTLSDCSVNNCVFTGENSRLRTADVVLVHINHGLLPKVKRDPKQLWVFLNDESPKHAFSMTQFKPNLKKWANVFNWSMTYRSTADVPVPYGRVVPLAKPLKDNVTYENIAELIPNLQFKRPDVLISILMSNCAVAFRMQFLNELQKHINIEVLGHCSKKNRPLCPGHFKADCFLLDQYYFYLVIENSMCRQYITEKVFYNAYNKGAIPIIVGPSIQDCKTLLPPNSYIHYDDFQSYKDLAAHVTETIQNIKQYLSYHVWRNHFEVKNEHGYFGTKSYHLCRLCQALNYNEPTKKSINYQTLKLYLDPQMLCMMQDERGSFV